MASEAEQVAAQQYAGDERITKDLQTEGFIKPRRIARWPQEWGLKIKKKQKQIDGRTERGT